MGQTEIERFQALREEFQALPYDARARTILDAFVDPYFQNRRVKALSTSAANYTKQEVAEFLERASNAERPLRAVWASLERKSYPAWHARATYQSLLTYHSYVAPAMPGADEVDEQALWREWELLERLRQELDPAATCHEIVGQALREGKVFYHPRISVDKRNGKVEYAYLQQLPSDYVRIVGLNSVSKYTVAFNLMYFVDVPGADPAQFWDLFAPFFGNFQDALVLPGKGRSAVFAGIDREKVLLAADERVEVEYESGTRWRPRGWYYWVTLPVDRVFPFEIDDTDRSVVPVFSGLFEDFMQLQQLKQIALSLEQNPLISFLVGEIPYWSDRSGVNDDQYKLSKSALKYYSYLWDEVMQRYGMDGIGFFGAPLANLHLESVAEAPGASQIVSSGYKDLMSQAGLTAIIPAGSEARAGAVNVSLAIESRMPQTVYRCYERMVRSIIDGLGLRHAWTFRMFGDLATDPDREKRLREDMALGILPAVIEYNAMHGSSLLGDLAMSRAVAGSGIMDLRIPLKSSWQSGGNEGGRPPSETVSSDGNEQDADGTG